MIRREDGTLEFPEGTDALTCFATEEGALAFAAERGWSEVEIVRWQVD